MTSGFYNNLLWYTALVQPRGGTSLARVVCEMPLQKLPYFVMSFADVSLPICLMQCHTFPLGLGKARK